MITNIFEFALQNAPLMLIALISLVLFSGIFYSHWKANHVGFLGTTTIVLLVLSLLMSLIVSLSMLSFGIAVWVLPHDDEAAVTATGTSSPPSATITPLATDNPTPTATVTLSPDEISRQEITNAVNTLLLSLTSPDLPVDWDRAITADYKDRLLSQYAGVNGISKHFKDRTITASNFRIDFEEPDHLSADVSVTLTEIVGEEKPLCEFRFLAVFKPGVNNGEGAWLIHSDEYWMTEGTAVAATNCY